MNKSKVTTTDKELDKLLSIMKFDNEEDHISHDAFILMAGYLSEIESIQEKYSITKKDLADKIKTSASYLTQVFRGDKPLNFHTLAKIKRALNIRFEVRAVDLNETFNQ